MISHRVLLLLICQPIVDLAFGDRVPNEWILRLKPGFSWNESRPFLPTVKSFGPLGQFSLFRSSLSFEALKQRFPEDVRIQPNFRYHSRDADPDFEKSWGLKNTGQLMQGIAGRVGIDIGVESAWNLHTENPTVVALIDSGMDTLHEDLKDSLWTNPDEIAANQIDDDGNGFVDDINGWNFIDDNANVQDDAGHGTFCAGIIGAHAGNGVGSSGIHRAVGLMVLKFLDRSGFGTTANAIRSIEYAVKHKASILNASWGGGEYDPSLYEVIQWAAQKEVLLVASAGNFAKNNDTDEYPNYPSSFKLPNIVAVAAYDNRDNLASFSNYGKKTVDLGAPGVAIFSTQPGGYRFADGTSYAAPFVTGVAALLKSYVPAISLNEWKTRLLMSSEVIDYYQKEITRSAGRVHAYNALLDLRPPRPLIPSHWVDFSTSIETPHPYANDTNKMFHLEHPGASHVRVHFRSFSTESCCDVVRLKDGEGKWVMSYRGEMGDFWSADALGDRLDIEIQTDSSLTKYGFEIDAYQVSFEQ